MKVRKVSESLQSGKNRRIKISKIGKIEMMLKITVV